MASKMCTLLFFKPVDTAAILRVAAFLLLSTTLVGIGAGCSTLVVRHQYAGYTSKEGGQEIDGVLIYPKCAYRDADFGIPLIFTVSRSVLPLSVGVLAIEDNRAGVCEQLVLSSLVVKEGTNHVEFIDRDAPIAVPFEAYRAEYYVDLDRVTSVENQKSLHLEVQYSITSSGRELRGELHRTFQPVHWKKTSVWQPISD